MIWSRFLALALVFTTAATAHGQADATHLKTKFLLERLTGVRWSPESEVFKQVKLLLEQGKAHEAARVATAQSSFINVTVQQMAAEMSTREEAIRTTLNDFTAGFMGVTRDERDARELLTANFFYMGDPVKVGRLGVTTNLVEDVLTTNRHYEQMQQKSVNYADALIRIERQMLILNDAKDTADNPDPAGILTSRAFIGAHASAGTNRRLVEYAFREFMCVPINEWADAAAPDLRIGRDIDRFPGGDHQVFQTSCKSCHTVMDGFRGAFSKWDFNEGNAIHSAVKGTERANPEANGTTGVMNKMNKNGTVFPAGFVMTDDSWINNAIRPANMSLFGWRRPGTDGAGSRLPTATGSALSGKGVNGLGKLMAESVRFPQCMAQRVFKTICKRDLSDDQLAYFSVRLGADFEQNGYNLKRLFEKTAIDPLCWGGK